MAGKKVRATRHNGRKGANGVFKAGHNDRTFEVENADHIDPSRANLNVYWDAVQGYNIADENGVRPERRYTFEEIELGLYQEMFGDSIYAQNERHEKSRHRERIRSVKEIHEDPKTCPEETVYQLGTKDGYVDPAIFVQVAAEVFEEFTKRYGSHVKILDWALHMDEATPHIHERHVFYADDGYGFDFPKQEKACEELGFELPHPDKKPSKKNNRKMSFDEEARQLYISIAEKHGVTIELVPLTGKVHLEKNDFILAKQTEEIAGKQATLDELTMKIEDIDTMVSEVAEKAYEKACEVVSETVFKETIREDIGIIADFEKTIVEAKDVAPERKKRDLKLLNKVAELLSRKGKAIVLEFKEMLFSPDTRKKNEAEIADVAKKSLLAQLQRKKNEVAEQEPREVEKNKSKGAR